jgi:hypothetical protein
VTVGPVLGGLVTSYFSWRWVFAGEVLLSAFILLNSGRMADVASTDHEAFDAPGFAISFVGMATTVFGVTQAGAWGWVHPSSSAPSLFGLSLAPVLIAGGVLTLVVFVVVERFRLRTGRPVILDPTLLKSQRIAGGLSSFFFMNSSMSGILSRTASVPGRLLRPDADSGVDFRMICRYSVALLAGAYLLATSLGLLARPTSCHGRE